MCAECERDPEPQPLVEEKDNRSLHTIGLLRVKRLTLPCSADPE